MVPFASSFFSPARAPAPAEQDESILRKKKRELEPKQPDSLARQGKRPAMMGNFLSGTLFGKGVY
jgi:hypothetical protein